MKYSSIDANTLPENEAHVKKEALAILTLFYEVQSMCDGCVCFDSLA